MRFATNVPLSQAPLLPQAATEVPDQSRETHIIQGAVSPQTLSGLQPFGCRETCGILFALRVTIAFSSFLKNFFSSDLASANPLGSSQLHAKTIFPMTSGGVKLQTLPRASFC